jgi:hypothetical protein
MAMAMATAAMMVIHLRQKAAVQKSAGERTCCHRQQRESQSALHRWQRQRLRHRTKRRRR